jgi:hypothetical protein
MKKTLIIISVFCVVFMPALAEWNQVPNNLQEPIVDLAATDTSELIALGASGNIFVSVDFGQTFQLTYDAGPNDRMNALYANSLLQYACGENGKIIEYNGSGWVESNTQTTNQLNDIHFSDNQFGFAVGELGTILKTEDGGNNWDTVNSPTNQWLTSVFVFDPNNVKIVGDGGLVIGTTNGGQTWDQTIIPGQPWLGSVWLNSPTNGWFSGTDGILYLMDEFGYSQYNTGTTNGIVSLNIPFPNYGHGVGDNGYITHWNGTTWDEIAGPTTDWLYAVTSAYNNDSKLNEVNVYSYACGENGTILASTDVVLGINTPAFPSKNVFLYPNPASENTFLSGLLEGEKAEVTIASVTGTNICSVHLEHPLHITLPLAGLADGTYLVSVKTDRGIFVEKLIIRH